MEFGGSGRDKKRKEVKKEKCKGTCVEKKKRGQKKGKRRRKKCGSVWRIKKEGKKKGKKKKKMVSQYFHNIFTINFK